jgi:hypothetical protein
MARDGSGRGVGSPAFLLQRLVRGHAVMLDEAVRAEQLWPTPTRQEDAGSAGYPTTSGRHQGWTLLDAVKGPTPTASDYGTNRGGAAGRVGAERPSLAGAVRGPLNPAWLESLMGFPVGWTAIDGPQDADTSNTPGNLPGP